MFMLLLSFSTEVHADLMSDLMKDFRRYHLIITLKSDTVDRRSLTTLRKEGNFPLSPKQKVNIKSHLKEGVRYLHDNLIIHGRISAEYVIIVEVRTNTVVSCMHRPKLFSCPLLSWRQDKEFWFQIALNQMYSNYYIDLLIRIIILFWLIDFNIFICNQILFA